MSDLPSVYPELIEKIREAAEIPGKGFGVFLAKRKSDGAEVYLLGIVEKLDKNGGATAETEMAVVAEFLPNKSTKDLYDMLNFWITPREEPAPPAPPLPKNVFQFRKKK